MGSWFSRDERRLDNLNEYDKSLFVCMGYIRRHTNNEYIPFVILDLIQKHYEIKHIVLCTIKSRSNHNESSNLCILPQFKHRIPTQHTQVNDNHVGSICHVRDIHILNKPELSRTKSQTTSYNAIFTCGESEGFSKRVNGFIYDRYSIHHQHQLELYSINVPDLPDDIHSNSLCYSKNHGCLMSIGGVGNEYSKYVKQVYSLQIADHQSDCQWRYDRIAEINKQRMNLSTLMIDKYNLLMIVGGIDPFWCVPYIHSLCL